MPQAAFMQKNDAENQDLSVAEQLHAVVDEMLSPYGKQSPRASTLLGNSPPFDTSKPNQHDTKAQFIRERDACKETLEHLDAVFSTLLPSEEDEAGREMFDALHPRIDQKLRDQARRIFADSPTSLVRKNIAEVGGSHVFLYMCLDLQSVIGDRLRELNEQEERFWNLKHRAPDYYAREIALRLARLFAQETGQFPTWGTSPHDGSGSTQFARALAKAFTILGIKSHTRGPAEWALGQLTETDMEPSGDAFEGLRGYGVPRQRNALEECLALMNDRRRQSE